MNILSDILFSFHLNELFVFCKWSRTWWPILLESFCHISSIHVFLFQACLTSYICLVKHRFPVSVLFSFNLGEMCPQAASPPSEIGSNSTYEELCVLLERMMNGFPLPGNVTNDVNPFKYKPSNLPGNYLLFLNLVGLNYFRASRIFIISEIFFFMIGLLYSWLFFQLLIRPIAICFFHQFSGSQSS